MPIKTFDDRMVRGQTWRATLTVKDERGARVDLTGATAMLCKTTSLGSYPTGSGAGKMCAGTRSRVARCCCSHKNPAVHK